MEATHLRKDDDDRYLVENAPLHDSKDDESAQAIVQSKDMMITERETEGSLKTTDGHVSAVNTHSMPISVEPLNPAPVEIDELKSETKEADNVYSQNAEKIFMHKNTMISRTRSKSACQDYCNELGPLSKSSPHYPYRKSKNHARKQINVKLIGERLPLMEAREELYALEETKNQAASRLDSLYNEIMPAIQDHKGDLEDSVSTSVAEKWVEANCCKLKAEFDLYSAIIKNIARRPQKEP